MSGQHVDPVFKKQEIQKREQSTMEVTWHNLLFFGTSSIV